MKPEELINDKYNLINNKHRKKLLDAVVNITADLLEEGFELEDIQKFLTDKTNKISKQATDIIFE